MTSPVTYLEDIERDEIMGDGLEEPRIGFEDIDTVIKDHEAAEIQPEKMIEAGEIQYFLSSKDEEEPTKRLQELLEKIDSFRPPSGPELTSDEILCKALMCKETGRKAFDEEFERLRTRLNDKLAQREIMEKKMEARKKFFLDTKEDRVRELSSFAPESGVLFDTLSRGVQKLRGLKRASSPEIKQDNWDYQLDLIFKCLEAIKQKSKQLLGGATQGSDSSQTLIDEFQESLVEAIVDIDFLILKPSTTLKLTIKMILRRIFEKQN